MGTPSLNESDEDKGKVFLIMVNFQQGITIKYYSMQNVYTQNKIMERRGLGFS
jgi:hypothetical protein